MVFGLSVLVRFGRLDRKVDQVSAVFFDNPLLIHLLGSNVIGFHVLLNARGRAQVPEPAQDQPLIGRN